MSCTVHLTPMNMMCRTRHREEVAKLKAELGSVQSSTKGGLQAADRSKKEMDKTKCAHAHVRPTACTCYMDGLNIMYTFHIMGAPACAGAAAGIGG